MLYHKVIFVLIFHSIVSLSQISKNYKLRKVEVFKSSFLKFTNDTSNNLEFGAIWMGNNPINCTFNKKELIVEVNNILISEKCIGKIEIKYDTLFLYSESRSKIKNNNCLRFIISNINETDFKEIKFISN